ncbi:hypothetical protein [Nitratireductor soli]|uniref:hypothetical protein n=1 Tax=Nitratireductor soli TaxID=1670619 RepID=UPI00065DF388|nr:hypothetical protein [Nitratireductor soli]
MGSLLGFGIGSWTKAGAVAVVLAGLAWSHLTVYGAGKQAVLDRLKDDRITVLKDGKAIDDEVLGADTDTLCGLLGGCLPDNGAD